MKAASLGLMEVRIVSSDCCKPCFFSSGDIRSVLPTLSPVNYPCLAPYSSSSTDTLVSDSEIIVPDKNEPILKKDHEYIIIWGYWNGTDEMLANYDGNYYTAINALSAYKHHLISKSTYFTLMETVKNKMMAVGIEDLNLRGTHILLSINSSNEIVTGEEGIPKTRICNFALLRRTGH